MWKWIRKYRISGDIKAFDEITKFSSSSDVLINEKPQRDCWFGVEYKDWQSLSK